MKHINFEQLKPQKYFFQEDFNINEIQLLFKLRTRMIDVKKNFSSIYQNLNCEICDENEIESQSHLIQCQKLLSMLPDGEIINDAKYEDIFENPQKQLKITRYIDKILKIREKLIGNSEKNDNLLDN